MQISVGDRFGEWTVLRRIENRGRHPMFECRCDCGSIKVVYGTHLIYGKSKSCGKHNEGTRKAHGMTGTKEHNTWLAMKRRCYNPNCRAHKYYGGRGIYVCDEWINDFDAFYRDVGPIPKGMTLDRIDNDGPYAPSNCRVVDQMAQCRDHRRNLMFSHNGTTMCLSDWADHFGIKYSTLRQRIKRGMGFEDAITN